MAVPISSSSRAEEGGVARAIVFCFIRHTWHRFPVISRISLVFRIETPFPPRRAEEAARVGLVRDDLNKATRCSNGGNLGQIFDPRRERPVTRLFKINTFSNGRRRDD